MLSNLLRSVILAAMLLISNAVEINLLDDFNIDGESVDNIVETEGLPYEGRAFSFGNVKKNLVQKGYLATEIAKQTKVYQGFTVTANIKINNDQECALFWIETEYTRPALGIWIKCQEDSCGLWMLYMVNWRSHEVQFDNIGPLYDESWHKLAVHVTGMKKGRESFASVYVDCANQGKKALVKDYNLLVPIINKKPTSSQIWLAQRSRGKTGGFERPWRGSLQNLKFVFNRDIEKLTDQTVCSSLRETRRKLHSPPVTQDDGKRTNPEEEKEEDGTSAREPLAAYVNQIQNILSNQVKEVQYLRRMMEKMNFANGRGTSSCQLKPCHAGVECTDTPEQTPGYQCGTCPVWMEGDGKNCTDLDECKYKPCFRGIKCKNMIEGYKCGPCPRGYQGGVVVGVGKEDAMKKQNCIDVDECINPKTCAKFSRCVNTMGSYKCSSCQSGYYGDPYVECKRFRYCSEHPQSNPCDKNARCISIHHGRSFECACRVGYIGNGEFCGKDSDLDGVPDYALACTGHECSKDNCRDFPNPDQSDLDNDGIGDMCDNDIDGDGIPNSKDNCPTTKNPDQKASDSDSLGDACDNCPTVSNEDQTDSDGVGQGDACDTDMDNDGVINRIDNCPVTRNSNQLDADGDGVGDACDNCPRHSNPAQEDTDLDFLGDACDTDKDGDRDGIQDSIDNCPRRANAAQLDNDMDKRGDACDIDDDNDFIFDIHDNCPFISNRYQKRPASYGRGIECKHDFDGDKVKDKDDACPRDATLSSVDFQQHLVFRPDGANTQNSVWKVENQGREVRKDTEDDSVFIGNRAFESVEFNSTLFVDADNGESTIGVVFGFQNAKVFYIVMWKKADLWKRNGGLVIKEVKSSTGPSKALHDALLSSQTVDKQTRILWKDLKKLTWEHRTAYKFVLSLDAARKRIRVNVFKGNDAIISSPELFATLYRGGRLGMFSFSQEKVIWTALNVKCLDL